MPATKFCSSCGETIKRNRLRFFTLLTFCHACRKRERANYFALLALLGFCLLTGFVIGRVTIKRQPFTFLGTPIDLQSTHNTLTNAASGDSGKANVNHQEKAGELEQPAEAETLSACGAPTKSGRPCRRKVRGGGYCWQHIKKGKPSLQGTQQTSGVAPQTLP